MLNIVLGSKSVHKREAVVAACSNLKFPVGAILEVAVDSRVNSQPVGMEETQQGAQNRAIYALRHMAPARQEQPDPKMIGIGIENGIIHVDGKLMQTEEGFYTIDLAVIAVYLPDNTWIFGTSPGMMMPEQYVKEAARSGYNRTTVGQIIAQHLGGDATDPHSTLTQGRITRQELLRIGVETALAQIKW